MADLPQVNAKQIELMKTIAYGEKDKPVFMLNLNCYTPEAGYPNGMLYKNYMNVLDRLLDEVGGKIVWRTNVEGTVVGEQCIHEALGIWYPSHESFLSLMTAPSSEKNMKLRSQAVLHADLHRCADYLTEQSRPKIL